MTGELAGRGDGETVGEAKWAALRELERLQPGPRQGARCGSRSSPRASAGCSASATRRRVWSPRSPPDAAEPPAEPPDERAVARRAERAARSLERIVARARRPLPDRACRGRTTQLVVTCTGGDLGAPDRPARPDDRRGPVPRERDRLARVRDEREARWWSTRPATARGARRRSRRSRTRSAERALAHGEPVELEPMTAVERKVVHLRLQDDAGVETRARARSRTATSSSAPAGSTSGD